MKNNFLFNLKNRKGDLSINILVMLVLLICVSSVFMFLTSNTKAEAVVAGAGLEITSILERHQVEAYCYEVAELALIDAYYAISLENDYVLPLNPLINEKFSESVYKGIKNIFSGKGQNYAYDNVHLLTLRNAILDENQFKRSDFKTDSEGVSFSVSGLYLSNTGDKSNVDYIATIQIGTTFNEAGLNSFQEIESAKDSCSGKDSQAEIENCFGEKLDYFYVSAEEKDDKWLIRLESTRSYLINGVVKPIELRFLI